MRRFHWWSLLGIFFLNSLAFGAEESTYNLPLEWQKIQLQEGIQKSLTEAIQAVVGGEEALVQVNLILSQAKTQTQRRRGTARVEPLEKLGISSKSKAYKRALSRGKQSVFDMISTVDVTVTVDSTTTREQEARIRSLVSGIVRSYSTKKLTLKLNRMEFLASKQEKAQDRSKENLTRQSNLQIATLLAEALRSAATISSEGSGKIAASIEELQKSAESKKGLMQASKDDKNGKAAMPMWLKWLIEFKEPLGIVLATLIALLGLSGFKSLERQKIGVMKQSAQAAASAGSTAGEVVTAGDQALELSIEGGAKAGSLSESEDALNGIDQFRSFAVQSPETAAYLIKQWLNLDSKAGNEAVAVITKTIPVDTLVPVFEQLDEAAKGKWKHVAMMVVDVSTIQRASEFIIGQVVQIFLLPGVELPGDLKHLLAGMTIKEYVACIRNDRNLGVGFINILQAPQVVRIMDMLGDEEANSLLQESLEFSGETLDYMLNNLGPQLAQVRGDDDGASIPIVDSSIELLRMLGPSREDMIFNVLENSGKVKQLQQAAIQFFPSRLILQLPLTLLKSVMMQMPSDQRASLILARSEDDQAILKSAIGQGTQLRELLDFEISQILASEDRKNKVAKEKAKIWNQFVLTARKEIAKGGEIKAQADLVLNKWLESKGAKVEEFDIASAA